VPTLQDVADKPQAYIVAPTKSNYQTGGLNGVVKRKGVVVQDDPNESQENRGRRQAVKDVRNLFPSAAQPSDPFYSQGI